MRIYITFIAILLTGCAARTNRVSSIPGAGSAYRVASVNGLPFVFPPSARTNEVEQHISVPGVRRGAAACSLTASTLPFQWDARGRIVRTHLAFENNFSQEGFRNSFEAFRAALEKLEQNRCLAPGDAQRILNRMTERQPLPYLETLFARYGYNTFKGFVDVRPGMHLHVQYAIVKPGHTTADRLEDFDIGTHHYDVVDGIRLKRTAGDASIFQRAAAEVPDLEAHTRAAYRIFYLTKFLKIAGQPERASNLLGTRTVAALQEGTAKFLQDAALTCDGKLTAEAPECVALSRRVFYQPQVQVTLNGKPDEIDVGMNVGYLFNQRKIKASSFMLERRYGKGYKPFRLPGEKSLATSIPLLTGDRIVWK